MNDHHDELWIVTTDDRRLFACHPDVVGAERRWIFVSTDKVSHVGPPWQRPLGAADVRALVNDWWTSEKSLSPA